MGYKINIPTYQMANYKGWSYLVDYGIFRDDISIYGNGKSLAYILAESNKPTLFPGIDPFVVSAVILEAQTGTKPFAITMNRYHIERARSILNQLKQELSFNFTLTTFSVRHGTAESEVRKYIDNIGDLLTYAKNHDYIK